MANSYPDENAGEIPMAYVVLAGGAAVSEADIMHFVAERVNELLFFVARLCQPKHS